MTLMELARTFFAPKDRAEQTAPEGGEQLQRMLELAEQADDLPAEASLGSLSREERWRRLFGSA